jgi:heterodisulfide reductase subunit B
MPYSYFPGCSLDGSGRSYDLSLRALFKSLDEDLIELDDWNCCGATAYFSVKETVAYAISARNLALAERAGLDLVVPCSACFCVLRKTKSLMEKVPELKEQIKEALAEGGLNNTFTVPVRHPLEVVLTDFGADGLLKRQKRSLEGWRIACYYGCQLIRPETALAKDDSEWPNTMELLFEALGAKTVYYPPKVRCCGGMLMATKPEIANDLCTDLVDWAKEGQANCIATTCPLCQSNLDMMQEEHRGKQGSNMPVLYFTQVLGYALGCDIESLGFEYHMIDPAERLAALLEKVA